MPNQTSEHPVKIPCNTNQKFMMLYIRDILMKDSSKDHPLTAEEIQSKLFDMGVSCKKRTVSNYIHALGSHSKDLRICAVRIGKCKAYYHDRTPSELGTIIYLIECVRNSTSLSQVETDQIIMWLKSQISNYEWDNILAKLPVHYAQKHTNDDVRESIAIIAQGIVLKKQVSLLYFDTIAYDKRHYHNGGQPYRISPLHITVDNERCYMMGYNEIKHDVRIYRLDRMEHVTALNVPISIDSEIASKNSETALTEMTEMFSGESVQMVVEFDEDITHILRDQYGDDLNIDRIGDKKYKTKIHVQVSPPLFGKIFALESHLKMTWPKYLVEKYKEWLIREAALYNLHLVPEPENLET